MKTRSHYDILDHLLLDYVSELRCPISFLAGFEIDELFNKPHHGMSVDELTTRLYGPLLNEVIVAEDVHGHALRLGREAIHDLLHMPTTAEGAYETLIGLSSKGGAIWESVFEPNWNLYFNDISFYLDQTAQPNTRRSTNSEMVTIEARAQGWVSRIVKAYLAHRPDILRTVNPKRLRPWHATYWKIFREGYSAAFYTSEHDENRMLPEEKLFLRESRQAWRRHWRSTGTELTL